MNKDYFYIGNIFESPQENSAIPQDSVCGANFCINFTGSGCQWNACIDHSAYCENNLCHKDSTNDFD